MPTYGYRCEACHDEFEHTKRMADPPPRRCPSCGSRRVSRVFTPPNVPCCGSSSSKHPAVADRLQPTGYQNGIPYYANRQGAPALENLGLNAVSFVNGPEGPRIVEHPNLAGSPPGCDSRDGRVVVVKDKKKK
jgi:putative FmdB family regulatory protein